MKKAMKLLFGFLSVAAAGVAQVTTIVAGAPWVFPASANGGPAVNAPLISVVAATVDQAGNVFAADEGNNFIVKVTPAGVLTIVAGTGVAGTTGDGGLATAAMITGPGAVALDSSGNLYFTDGNRVREVTQDGIIHTVAGNGSSVYYGSGDGGPAIYAYINDPHSLAFDGGGNLYIADNSGIRKVDTSGIITTVVNAYAAQSSGAQLGIPSGIALDSKATLYISDYWNYRVWKADASGNLTAVAGNGQYGSSGDGGPATSAELQWPEYISVDPTGVLYLGDLHRIRKVTPDGAISTIAQLNGQSLVGTDLSENFYVGALADIGVAGSGQLFKLSPSGAITLVAGSGAQNYYGDGGPATSAQLREPNGLALDQAGNLYLADSGNSRVRLVTPNGIISTIAGTTSGFSGDGGLAVNAQLGSPQGLVLDGSGNLYIADGPNHRIRMITPDGIINTVAGTGQPGFSGDGGLATAAELNWPTGLAMDSAGYLYVADTLNYRVRKIAPDGTITTAAGTGQAGFSGDGGLAVGAQMESPSAVAVDSAGNLFIVDSEVWNGVGFSNQRVRVVNSSGIITTFAGNGIGGYSGDGGPAINAELCYPQGIAVDAAGNVYILDSGNDAVRKVSLDGTITTVNLNSSVYLNLSVHDYLKSAGMIAVDSAGSLYVSDYWENLVLKVTGPAAPYFVSSSVVNAATLDSASGVLAPGGIVSIFGQSLADATVIASEPLPPSLADTTVTIAGLTAPLFFVSPVQINAMVPFEAPLGTVPLEVTRRSTGAATLSLNLSAVSPGIFTLGNGQGAIVTSTGEIAAEGPTFSGAPARPAHPGESVSIYMTGLGNVTNPPADGAPVPSGPPYSETILSPVVMIAGTPVTPTFSGLAPLFAGLYQVNFQIPETTPAGVAVPVAVTIGTALSNLVTIAVQ
jgi:trimeric autotransporter adhesin